MGLCVWGRGLVRHHGSLMVVSSRLSGRTKVQGIVLKDVDGPIGLLHSSYVVFSKPL